MRTPRRSMTAGVVLVVVATLLGACTDDASDVGISASPSPPSDGVSPASPSLTKEDFRAIRTKAAKERRKIHAAAQRARERARRELGEADVSLTETMRLVFSYYNNNEFSDIPRYVDGSVVDRCGGSTGLAYAFAQNKEAERLSYALDELEVAQLGDRSATVRLTFSTRDDRSGQVSDEDVTVDLSFVKAPRRETGWVLEELFPEGVRAYC